LQHLISLFTVKAFVSNDEESDTSGPEQVEFCTHRRVNVYLPHVADYIHHRNSYHLHVDLSIPLNYIAGLFAYIYAMDPKSC